MQCAMAASSPSTHVGVPVPHADWRETQFKQTGLTAAWAGGKARAAPSRTSAKAALLNVRHALIVDVLYHNLNSFLEFLVRTVKWSTSLSSLEFPLLRTRLPLAAKVVPQASTTWLRVIRSDAPITSERYFSTASRGALLSSFLDNRSAAERRALHCPRFGRL